MADDVLFKAQLALKESASAFSLVTATGAMIVELGVHLQNPGNAGVTEVGFVG